MAKRLLSVRDVMSVLFTDEYDDDDDEPIMEGSDMEIDDDDDDCGVMQNSDDEIDIYMDRHDDIDDTDVPIRYCSLLSSPLAEPVIKRPNVQTYNVVSVQSQDIVSTRISPLTESVTEIPSVTTQILQDNISTQTNTQQLVTLPSISVSSGACNEPCPQNKKSKKTKRTCTTTCICGLPHCSAR